MKLTDKINTLSLSKLPHTWILDLDGTIVKHNGYKLDGKDSLLEKECKTLFTFFGGKRISGLLTSKGLGENCKRGEPFRLGSPLLTHPS